MLSLTCVALSDRPIFLTYDVQLDGVVDGGRLPEVDPAHEGAGVEALHARHAEDGRRGGGAEVGAVTEGRRLRPQVGPRRRQRRRRRPRAATTGGRGGLALAPESGVVTGRETVMDMKQGPATH